MAALLQSTDDLPQADAPAPPAVRWRWHVSGLIIACVAAATLVLWPADEPSHPPEVPPAPPRGGTEVARIYPGPGDRVRPIVTDSAVRTEVRAMNVPAARSSGGLRDPDASVASLTDAEIADRLLGRWRTNLYGEQIIENREGGAAQLTAKLDFLSSLIYGERLEMNLQWEVRDGVLTHVISGGSPESNVRRLIRDQGDRRSYRILSLSDSTLELQDIEDASTLRTWSRLPAN